MTRPAKGRWGRVRRVGFVAFLLLSAVLLFRQGRTIDWRQVGASLAAYDARTVAMAAALSLASYLLYACYDLSARVYTGHRLPAARVLATAAVSYAFSLNLGALVGSAGFRLRLYTRQGLDKGTTGRIIAFSILTNWVGYLLLAGMLFVSGAVHVPPAWRLAETGLRWLGAALLMLTVAYAVSCHFTRGRALRVRGHGLRLPTLPLALVQLALSTGNWALMAVLVWVLMPAEVGYVGVLGAMLLAAVAGAIAQVPAGLGVQEAVFIPLLAPQAPVPQVLAALLAWRAFYYLGPLLLALAGYGLLERTRRRRAAR